MSWCAELFTVPRSAWLVSLVELLLRLGCLALLRCLGERVNVKRVYRLYQEELLHLLCKRHRKRIAGPRGALLPCSRPNQRWSLDFMTDSLGSGRRFRMLSVIDDCTRECLCIEVSTGFSGRHVARVLERLCQQRGQPEVIRSDNGPESTSKAVQDWAKERASTCTASSQGSPRRTPTSRASTASYASSA
jgi:putative transposase